jgi:hypothetical protein
MYNSDIYRKNSRFLRNAELIIDEEGKKRIGRFLLSKLDKSSNDIYYQFTSSYENRLDLISLEFYGTSKLGWAIALANDKTNLLDWPVSGDIIRIPSYENIMRHI